MTTFGGYIILVILGEPAQELVSFSSLFHPSNKHLKIFDFREQKLYSAENFSMSMFLRKNELDHSLLDCLCFKRSDYKAYLSYYKKMKAIVNQLYNNILLRDPNFGKTDIFQIPMQENGFKLDLEKTAITNINLYTSSERNGVYGYCVSGKLALSSLLTVLQDLHKAKDASQKSPIISRSTAYVEHFLKVNNSVIRLLSFVVDSIDLKRRLETLLSAMSEPMAYFFYARSLYPHKGDQRNEAIKCLKISYQTSERIEISSLQDFIRKNIAEFPFFKGWENKSEIIPHLSMKTIQESTPEFETSASQTSPPLLLSNGSKTSSLEKKAEMDPPPKMDLKREMDAKKEMEVKKEMDVESSRDAIDQKDQLEHRFLKNKINSVLLNIPLGKLNRKAKGPSDPERILQRKKKGKSNDLFYCLKLHAMLEPNYLKRQKSQDRKAASSFRKALYRSDIILYDIIAPLLARFESSDHFNGKMIGNNKEKTCLLLSTAATIYNEQAKKEILEEMGLKSYSECVETFIDAFKKSYNTNPFNFFDEYKRTEQISAMVKFLTNLGLNPKAEFDSFIEKYHSRIHSMGLKISINHFEEMSTNEQFMIAIL